MQLRVRWMLFVLAVMLVAAFSIDEASLPLAGRVAAQAQVARVVPIVTNTPPWSANPVLNSDAFWLGIILALVLALAMVYVRWAVFERKTV